MNILYESKEMQLESGDKILLFTEGITDAINDLNEPFDIKRIVNAIKRTYTQSSDDILNAVVYDLKAFTDIENLKNDATIFITEVK